MLIVIDIPEEDYNRIKDIPEAFNSLPTRAFKSIKNGTPLPKGHGRLVDADDLLDCKYEIDSMYCMYDEVVNVDDIKNAPTIIEADK